MSDDMSNIMDNISQMLKNNEIPEDLKNIMNEFANSSKSSSGSNNSSSNNISDILLAMQNNSEKKSESSNSKNNDDNNFSNKNSNDSNNNSSFDFDIGTIMKMKSVMDAMNSQKDDPRANLLKSLKPYLKPSRKEKVDQYVKLFSMGKVFEMLNPLGGEKKNDV